MNQMLLLLVVLGIGMGFIFAALNTRIINTVKPEQVSIASSIFVLVALIGNTLAVIMTTMLYVGTSEKALLKQISHYLPSVSQPQAQQIHEAIMSSTAYPRLSLFDNVAQLHILQDMAAALTHGVNNVMLLNVMIAVVAALCCLKINCGVKSFFKHVGKQLEDY